MQRLNLKPEELLRQVREAMDEIDLRLREPATRDVGESHATPGELTVIRAELARIETQLLTSTVHENSFRTVSIGRIVTDTWDIRRDPLAKQLMAIVDSYKRKLAASGSG